MKLVKPQAPWEGEIEEGADAEHKESFISQAASWVFQRADRVNVALVAVSVVVIGFSLLLIYSQYQRNRASLESIQAQLEIAQRENVDLMKQVADLQNPIQGVLADKDKRIAELLQQVENVSKERDSAVIEKQKLNDAAILSKAQADRATQAQKQAETTLATVQADRDDTQRSYQDVVSKYAASQKEVRSLQGRLA